MRSLKLVLFVLMLFALNACSSKSGSGGASSADDIEAADFGEGNIPVAEAGQVLVDVNFAYDSSAITPEAMNALKGHTSWLRQNAGKKVVIEGHCDERGTPEYNLALGDRRARAVFDYLRNAGVAATQMTTVSYGEELPLDPRSNEMAWAKNRRAHFAVE